jgi:hypothetical protein
MKLIIGAMKTISLKGRSGGILDAIAHGRSIYDILARDRSVTCHDIFHAVSEAPTSHWRRADFHDEPGFLLPRDLDARQVCQRVD